MRDLLCPIVFLYQNHEGIMLHINGYECGHTTLLYSKHGDSDLTQVILNSEDVFITSFPKGSGTYDFFLQKNNVKTGSLSMYINTDSDKDMLSKIAGYISNPEDNDYITSIISSIRDIDTDYLSVILNKYRAVKDIQDYEEKCYWQLLNATEHYMNLLSTTACKNNTSVTVTYSPYFEVFHEFAVDCIDLYYDDNGIRRFLRRIDTESESINKFFIPDRLHYVDIYAYGELALELYHYEPSEKGSAYFWKENSGSIVDTDIVLSDQELAYVGIELTDEEKGRIIEERTYQNIDAFCPRVKISVKASDANILHMSVSNYPMIARMRKKYYISVCPAEAFPDAFYNIRYELTSPSISVDIQKDLLQEEILVWVEDENHVVVSPYTRYDPEGNLEGYYEKENLLDMKDYKDNMLTNFEASFGRNQSYSVCENIVSSYYYDDDMTPEKLRMLTMLKLIQESLLKDDIDYIIYFMMSNYLSNFNRNDNFFDTKPILEYSTRRIVLPPRETNYITIVESCKLSDTEMNLDYYPSSTNSTIEIILENNYIYNIYSLDETTYERSGFIFINNIGEKKYYTGGIKIEVK